MKPNYQLKRERELRGWPQVKVAKELNTDARNVRRWERGATVSPFFRERLCVLFEKNADELGLLSSEKSSDEDKFSYKAEQKETTSASTDGITNATSSVSWNTQPLETRDTQPQYTPIKTGHEQFSRAFEDQQSFAAHMLQDLARTASNQGGTQKAQILREVSLMLLEEIDPQEATHIRQLLNYQSKRNADTDPSLVPPLQEKKEAPSTKQLRKTRVRGQFTILFVVFLLLFMLILTVAVVPTFQGNTSNRASSPACFTGSSQTSGKQTRGTCSSTQLSTTNETASTRCLARGSREATRDCPNAEFISQIVPLETMAAHLYWAQVTMKRTSGPNWNGTDLSHTNGSLFHLGSQNPQDNFRWNPQYNRIDGWSPPTKADIWQFNFQITTPSIPGTYHFQWQMVNDSIGWFEDKTPDVSIHVS